MESRLQRDQRTLCERVGAEPLFLYTNDKLGVSRNVESGDWPLNGLRNRVIGDTCGWFIWAGEVVSEAEDFFRPFHAIHVIERRPELIPYLALPPGWRFLIAPGYEDVWFDPALLDEPG